VLKPKTTKIKNAKQLMKNKMLVGGTILMLAATSALGAGTVSNNQGDYYQSSELSVDAFGTGSLGEYTLQHLSGPRVQQNVRLGAGVGVNYFLTRNLGIGADAYSENTTGAFIDSASASLILRLPLGQSGFAPYAFGGGGHQFEMANCGLVSLAPAWNIASPRMWEYSLTPARCCRTKQDIMASPGSACASPFNWCIHCCAGGKSAGAFFFSKFTARRLSFSGSATNNAR